MREQIALAVFSVGALLVWAAFRAGLLGLAVWFHVSCPVASKRMLRVYRGRPYKALLVGAVNGVLGLVVSLVLVNEAPLLGVLMFLILGTGGALGFSLVYRDLGERIDSTLDRPMSIVAGGLVVETALLVPVLGQLLGIWVGFRGLGAVILALLQRRGQDQAQKTPSEDG